MADTADHRVQNQFLFTVPYISMARLYTKMAAVFRNYVIICTRNDVIENALYTAQVRSSPFTFIPFFFFRFLEKVEVFWRDLDIVVSRVKGRGASRYIVRFISYMQLIDDSRCQKSLLIELPALVYGACALANTRSAPSARGSGSGNETSTLSVSTGWGTYHTEEDILPL